MVTGIEPSAVKVVLLVAGGCRGGRIIDITAGAHAWRTVPLLFTTTLVTNHAEPREVQRLLRHKTLRITLKTYAHW